MVADKELRVEPCMHLSMVVLAEQRTLVQFGLNDLPAHLRTDLEVLVSGVSVVEIEPNRVVVVAQSTTAPQVLDSPLLES